MEDKRYWPNGARARSGKLLTGLNCYVYVYRNYDGSWYVLHSHGGRHMGLKHPVQREEVEFTDGNG